VFPRCKHSVLSPRKSAKTATGKMITVFAEWKADEEQRWLGKEEGKIRAKGQKLSEEKVDEKKLKSNFEN